MPASQTTLYLHVGPAKTGTSAVQHLLRDLRDDRLTYPRTGQWPDGSHNLLHFALEGQSQWGAQQIPPLQELIPQLTAELRAAPQDVLISSEGFATPAALQRLFDALGKETARFDRIVPIYVLRHPLERAASAYNQMVKDAAHGETRLPDAYLAQSTAHHLLAPAIREWQAFAPDLRMLSYHSAETLVPRFLDLIGRPDLAPPQTQWRNRSLGGVGLALTLLINRHLPDVAARNQAFDAMRRIDDVKPWYGASFPFSNKAVGLAMSEAITADLAQVKALSGLDMTDWQRPARISLEASDRALVHQAAAQILGGGAEIAADADTIVTALAAPELVQPA